MGRERTPVKHFNPLTDGANDCVVRRQSGASGGVEKTIKKKTSEKTPDKKAAKINRRPAYRPTDEASRLAVLRAVKKEAKSSDMQGFKGQHLLSARSVTVKQLDAACGAAQTLKDRVEAGEVLDLCKGRVLASAFFEPSTRTSCSFTAAMMRLGGQVLHLPDTSSVKKGETLSDTMATLLAYSDLAVMRHPEKGAVQKVASMSSKPILNGGDGAGEHPTQAMLDVFTMRSELGSMDGLNIALLGDLKHGRTVHSLVQLLSHYNVTLQYVSPEILKMPKEITDELDSLSVKQAHSTELTPEIVAACDVLYVTRVQKERFEDLAEYERVKGTYIISKETLTAAKSKMVVMHPLPRVGEILEEVDTDPRAAYFRQMEYGMYMRMALIAGVLGVEC